MDGRNDSKLNSEPSARQPTSLTTLILWNVSKALEKNPYIDLRNAIKAAQEHLDHDSRDVAAMISQRPDDRHLACAFLAWQQLGHHDAESLYQFIETKTKKKEMNIIPKEDALRSNTFKLKDAYCMRAASTSIDSYTMGPVVKLPTQTNIVMRMEKAPGARPCQKKPRAPEKDVMEKIDAACCLDSACLERLTELDTMTNELRRRAARLARRESERVELLERAEAAWKDLEMGYQRRLNLAEEKEEDMTRQIARLIDERDGYKNVCTTLSKQLKERAAIAEKERARLSQVDKDVYDRACVKLRLSEEASRGDAALAEQQCRAAQLDRDLQFKEEQARRKIMSLESEVESARTLTHEAERAMRAELGALRDQVAKVSNELLDEDAQNALIKQELEDLRQEKMELVEDLEGCKVACDSGMQGRIDELNKKREQLGGLKQRDIECRCKLPVDVSIEVKRTPSLAALCHCSPEEKLVDSCSCTSLRSRLLSNLLQDLFAGLQAELGETGTQMPCQLLKCLEDRHNWDRASGVKTNLRNFFSQLLIGELDIAIATSIEKYHAKWIGASCADEARLIPDPREEENEGWQERALELKAQKLATKFAEQLFKERAEELEKRAKDIVASGPPPCECGTKTEKREALFPCLVKPTNMPRNEGKTSTSNGTGASSYWRRTLQDVIQLRMQIEDLKKDSIKKADLKLMEANITKMVQRASNLESPNIVSASNPDPESINELSKKENKTLLLRTSTDHYKSVSSNIKPGALQKKQLGNTTFKKEKPKDYITQVEKPLKQHKRFRQDYSINMCLCSNERDQKQPTKLAPSVISDERKKMWKQKPSKDVVSQMPSIKQSKPINKNLSSSVVTTLGIIKESTQGSCLMKCNCFNKSPSTTSIDKLLETLARWKSDLMYSEEKLRETADEKDINTVNINNKISIDSSSVVKKTFQENQNGSNCSKIPLDRSKTSFSSHGNKSKDKEFVHDLPTTTESEYMGAINLDKSNDICCKCDKDGDDEKENVVKIQRKSNSDFPVKCINSGKCCCRNFIEMKDNKTTMDKDSIIELQLTEDSKIAMLQNTSQSKQVVDVNVEQNLEDIETSAVFKETFKMNDDAQKSLFPYDCNYYVRFLGVTLADANSAKKITKTLNDVGKNEEGEVFVESLSHEQTYKNLKDHSQVDTTPYLNMSSIYGKQKSTCDEKDLSCGCKVNFEELKGFICGFLDTKTDKGIPNQDKSFDTESMNVGASENGNCICCEDDDIEESKNLEENAFNLLEEHLKQKLQNFKLSYCKSTCIPPNEEEKLYSAILKRVRQVISNSTKQIVCKCSDEGQTEGSWNRAYGLLQEYLKVKLKRVQCSCASSSEKNDTGTPLDDVLEKVCQLIENDFERLKSICNCKVLSNNTVKNMYKPMYSEDLPEKDTNNSNTNSLMSATQYRSPEALALDNNDFFEMQSKQNSNAEIITQNISSQVPPYLGMESKSCNAIERGSKNVQTQESKNVVFDKSCKTSLCSCTKKQSEGPFLELLGTNEVCVGHCTEITKLNNISNNMNVPPYVEKNCKQPVNVISFHKENIVNYEDENFEKTESHSVPIVNIPYIGNTIDCSCVGKINSCVCVKSLVQSNNDRIVSIWKMFTNISIPNVSYIMDSIIDRNKQEKNDIMDMLTQDIYANNIPDLISIQQNQHHLCDVKTSAIHQDEAIILKNSTTYLDQTNHMTNTRSENLSSNYSIVEDSTDWFDCGTRIDKSQISFINDEFENVMNSDLPNVKNSERVKIIDIKETSSLYSETKNCDCGTVPVCHVKMLVESIEDKLLHAKCTCDSLISEVCPVHSASPSA